MRDQLHKTHADPVTNLQAVVAPVPAHGATPTVNVEPSKQKFSLNSILTFRKYTLELAEANDRREAEISLFLHDVYSSELGYYPRSPEMRFEDAFGDETFYIVVMDEGQIVGVQGVLLCSNDYPMRQRVNGSKFLDGIGPGGVELRLLAIAKDKRKSDIFLAIVMGINHFLRSRSHLSFALTSAKAGNVPLYEKVGFKTFAESEVFGSTSFHMHASRQTLEAAVDRFLRFASR